MKQKCIEISEIATVLRLPADDPRRRHLEECPRCASRLLLYQRFLSQEEIPGADPASADAHLARVMKSAIDSRKRPVDVPQGRGILERITQVLFPRPAWAAATVVLVAIVAVALWRPWTMDETILRSGDTPRLETIPLSLAPPEMLKDGSIRFTWRPMENAESYVVHIRTPDLTEVAIFGAITDTSFVLHRSMLPPETPPVVLWRVVALQKGDEIGRSRPASLELP